MDFLNFPKFHEWAHNSKIYSWMLSKVWLWVSFVTSVEIGVRILSYEYQSMSRFIVDSISKGGF